MDEQNFGIYLAKIRERNGYKSQRQLALDAGISPATLSRIEAGLQNAQPYTLKRLAPFLHVTYEELMEKCGYLSHDRDDSDTSLPPEEREFLEWVKEHVTGQFFYDFHQSRDKDAYMESLKLVWKMEKGRKPGQKQGE